jgi:hypothetical protein
MTGCTALRLPSQGDPGAVHPLSLGTILPSVPAVATPCQLPAASGGHGPRIPAVGLRYQLRVGSGEVIEPGKNLFPATHWTAAPLAPISNFGGPLMPEMATPAAASAASRGDRPWIPPHGLRCQVGPGSGDIVETSEYLPTATRRAARPRGPVVGSGLPLVPELAPPQELSVTARRHVRWVPACRLSSKLGVRYGKRPTYHTRDPKTSLSP